MRNDTTVKKKKKKEFPGVCVVRTPCFHRRSTGLIPGWGTKIPHAMWCSQKEIKQQQSGNNPSESEH